MPGTRFILVGEDVFARKTAEVIASDARGELYHIFTNMNREGVLHRFARDNDIPISDSGTLMSSPAPVLRADWLINVNSALLLPPEVLNQFTDHALNLHNGPLPEYAGRHVHQWAIRNGERTSAATIHQLAAGVDTGDIVLCREYDITPEDTGLSAFRKSFETGVIAFAEVLGMVLEGKQLPRQRQATTGRRNYRHKDALDCRIDWNWTSRKVIDFIRAGNYRPLVSPTYSACIIDPDGCLITVLKAETHAGFDGEVGEVRILGGMPVVVCSDGCISFIEATRDNTRMTSKDWVDTLPDGTFFLLVGRSAAA